MIRSEMLGTEKVRKLIFNLGWPAALNFLVLTIFNITDIVFAGHFLGSMSIAAVVIGGTAIFLFSSFGLAVGIGGASIISRALGEKDAKKAGQVFGNQVMLTLVFGLFIVLAGLIFEDAVLKQLGAYGDIFLPARAYYRIILLGVPFLSLVMMGNNVIQAEGKAKVVMVNSLIPIVVNIVLNPLLIKGFNMGIEGAAWATMIGFITGFLLIVRFFSGKASEVRLNYREFKPDRKLAREILVIGGSVVINAVATNIFIVFLNKVLFKYQQESGVVIYSIISRIGMLFLIPILGIDGGVRPIIGYNYGNGQMDRVRVAVQAAIKYGLTASYILLGGMFLCANYLVRLFTTDPHVIAATPYAMKVVFSFFPLFVVEIITVAYFQAIGKPAISFFLTLLRYIILQIPLLMLLPYFWGYEGVLYAFPTLDILTTLAAFWLLRNELIVKLPQRAAANFR